MNRFSLSLSLVTATLGVNVPCSNALAEPRAKRLSVVDFFFLLPWVSESSSSPDHPSERRRRRALLEAENSPVVDLRHDFLRVQSDSWPADQVAVFRGPSGDVVAISSPDDQSDYNFFAFYRLRGGKLRDVTRSLLPAPLSRNRYLLELPRLGTTIRVFWFNLEQHKRKHAFDLLWRQGRFVKQ